MTIKKLGVGAKLIPQIPTGSTLVIRSMEHEKTLDKPIINMIEDYLVKECLDSRFKLMERDQDVVKKLIKERNTYSLLNDSLSLKNYYPSHIKSASYLLAYRVLECGIRTTPINRKSLYREALVRLHIRLINTKTGHIKYVRNIASIQSDEVSNHMNEYYQNFHYSIFKNEFPLQKKKESSK